MEGQGSLSEMNIVVFTAELRRQLANDHCNSSCFFSWGDEFFFVLLLKLFWPCRPSDRTSDDRPSRNLDSVGSNFATILPCSTTFWVALKTFFAELRTCKRRTTSPRSAVILQLFCLVILPWKSHLGFWEAYLFNMA